MSESIVWSEKYRPKKLNEIINQKHVIERIKAFVSDKNLPNMIFAGTPGSGKTTTALAIAHELYGDSWRQNVLETNASDERGIDTIRNKVKDFARTRSFGNASFKIIILDEADALTTEAQQALRRTMESFTNTSRFILICNYSNKIIEPIQSRCSVFRFKPLVDADIKKYVERIVDGEKFKINEDAIKAVIEISEGDLRKVTNLMQTSAAMGTKITEDVVYDIASKAKPTDVKVMLEIALSGNFKKARDKLFDLMYKQGLGGSDIVSEIHRQIYSVSGLGEKDRVCLIEKCGEYEFRISQGANELIQIEALLSQFLLHSKKG